MRSWHRLTMEGPQLLQRPARRPLAACIRERAAHTGMAPGVGSAPGPHPVTRNPGRSGVMPEASTGVSPHVANARPGIAPAFRCSTCNVCSGAT